jgi:hypothetical protein
MSDLLIMSSDELSSVDGGLSVDALLGGAIFLGVTVGLFAIALNPVASVGLVAATAFGGSVTWTAGVTSTIYGLIA